MSEQNENIAYPCLVVSKGKSEVRLIGTALLSDGRYRLVKQEPNDDSRRPQPDLPDPMKAE